MQWVCFCQSVYFLLTGIWPLLHIRSFLAVTGPKHDLWLVKTVGILVAVVGAVLLSAALRDGVTAEIAALAVGSAVALLVVDVIYVRKGVISRIYLLDALAEGLLILAWVIAKAAH